MTNAVLPIMQRQRSGRIVNLSSILGVIPAPFSARYAAAKHAVEGYSESLDHEVRSMGIRVAAPKQRNTAAEREAIKAGRTAAQIWPDEPAKAAHKDTDARWTLKFAKARVLPDGRPGIAIPSFGYKSSIAICRRYGFIRRGKVTAGARFDGRMLRDVVPATTPPPTSGRTRRIAAAPTKPG